MISYFNMLSLFAVFVSVSGYSMNQSFCSAHGDSIEINNDFIRIENSSDECFYYILSNRKFSSPVYSDLRLLIGKSKIALHRGKLDKGCQSCSKLEKYLDCSEVKYIKMSDVFDLYKERNTEILESEARELLNDLFKKKN